MASVASPFAVAPRASASVECRRRRAVACSCAWPKPPRLAVARVHGGGAFRRAAHVRCEAGASDSVRVTGGAEQNATRDPAEQKELWWKALKLPIFTVSLIPLLVGAATAYLQTGLFAARLFSCFAVGGFLITAWLNLSNDAYDSETEVDKAKLESVVNLTQNRAGVLTVARVCLVLGGALLAYAVRSAGDARAGWMLAAAVAIGHMYQAPPFRLSYKGLGEPLCFVAYGPLATNAFYYAMAAAATHTPTELSAAAMAACVLVGMTTSVILFCSHFHQRDGDMAAGKLSPIVRLGLPTAARVLHVPLRLVHVLGAVAVLFDVLPWTCLVASTLTLPLAFAVESFVDTNHLNPQLVAPAKIVATRWHAAHGFLLAASIAAGRLVV